MDKSKRLLEIDSIRGLAALGVVLFHYTVAFKDQYSHSSSIFPLFRYFRYGKYGVAMFFIISGFFILMSLGRTRSILDFIAARFSRLYPVYWTAVILSFTTITIANIFPFEGNLVSWKDALINMSMLQDFFQVPHIDGSYWTLSLELSFYIIMLTLWHSRLLKHVDFLVFIWLLAISASFLLEQQSILLINPSIKILLVSEYAHLFIIGILLYRIHFYGLSNPRYLGILFCFLFSFFKHGLEPTLFVMLFVLIFALALRGFLAFITFKPLLFLGSISYSLYLTHVYTGLLIIKTLDELKFNINISIFIALVSAVCLATIITFYIEAPAAKFIKNKYERIARNKPML